MRVFHIYTVRFFSSIDFSIRLVLVLINGTICFVFCFWPYCLTNMALQRMVFLYKDGLSLMIRLNLMSALCLCACITWRKFWIKIKLTLSKSRDDFRNGIFSSTELYNLFWNLINSTDHIHYHSKVSHPLPRSVRIRIFQYKIITLQIWMSLQFYCISSLLMSFVTYCFCI